MPLNVFILCIASICLNKFGASVCQIRRRSTCSFDEGDEVEEAVAEPACEEGGSCELLAAAVPAAGPSLAEPLCWRAGVPRASGLWAPVWPRRARETITIRIALLPSFVKQRHQQK